MTDTTEPRFVVTMPRRSAGRGGKVHVDTCRHLRPLTHTRPAYERDMAVQRHHCACVADALARAEIERNR